MSETVVSLVAINVLMNGLVTTPGRGDHSLIKTTVLAALKKREMSPCVLRTDSFTKGLEKMALTENSPFMGKKTGGLDSQPGKAISQGVVVGCLTSQQQLVYLTDGSAQRSLRAATLRQKLQLKLSTSLIHQADQSQR